MVFACFFFAGAFKLGRCVMKLIEVFFLTVGNFVCGLKVEVSLDRKLE